MKYVVGCLAVAATLAGGSAQAVQVSGNSTLNFSSQWVEASNLAQSNAQPFLSTNSISPALATEEIPFDPIFGDFYRSAISLTSPISSVNYSSSFDISTVQTSGGILLTAARLSAVSVGGVLGISDLRIDLTSKRVYATLTGNFSGVANHTFALPTNSTISTVEDFYLFDYQSLVGPSTVSVGNMSTFTVTGLTITQEGHDHFVSALRLIFIGERIWSTISEYGSITTSITAVPEPSTYGLALAGIAIVAAVKRKRSA